MTVSGGSDIVRGEGKTSGTLSLCLEEAFDLIKRAGGTVHGVKFTTVLAEEGPLHSALILFTDKTDEKH